MKKVRLAVLLAPLLTGLFLIATPAFAAPSDHLELDQTTQVRLTPDQSEAILTVDLPESGKVSMTFNTYFPYAKYTVLSEEKWVIEPTLLFDGTPESPETGTHDMYLEKGRYTILLSTYQEWTPEIPYRDFSVRFGFTPAGTNEKEPNETTETSLALPLNSEPVRGLLSWSDQSDLYKLEVPKAGRISLDYVTDAEDSLFTLLDAAGKELYEKRCYQQVDGTFQPYTLATHLEAGTYYIDVHASGLSIYRGGLYSLQAAFSPIKTDDQEPNNDIASAQPLPIGKWMTGLLSYTDSVDYHKLTLTKPMNIRMNFDFAIPSYEVQIKSSSGKWVYLTNDSFDRDDTPGKFTKELKLEPDSYIIKITGPYAPSETGIYRLFAEDLALTKQFADVPPAYKEGVDYLVRNNITNGITSTTFGVSQKLKRADAAILLAKALGIDTSTPVTGTFKDVPKRAAGAIEALKERRIMSGKSSDYFGADDPLTRGEVALILDQAYNLNGYGLTNQFSDVSKRYETAVNAMVKYNITKGKSLTLFGTADPITRGEIALFMYRASEVKK